MKIHALQQIITSGSNSYPIFIGFLPAADLLKVAEVPNFKDSTPNEAIATNVLTPPVKEWQRPLIDEKVDRIIQTFNGTGEFMPNPVLLSERRVGPPPVITITPLLAMGGIATGIQIIEIQEAQGGQSPPLWIIDGQHRITGLGSTKCKQRDNVLPVVLLLNNGGSFYNGRNLAKIFAQVTTEATPLAPLHKEWLTFAFHLDQYVAGSSAHKAMESVAWLCKTPHNPLTNAPNGFHDDIKFNDKLLSQPQYLGHQYDCKDLAILFDKFYYGESSGMTHLSPSDLANQVSMAFHVLKQSVTAPHNRTVFFGDSKHSHKIMLDAFIVGTLTYLRTVLTTPTELDWRNLLTKLNFPLTDWNFQQHVVSASRWVDKSKALALDVFASVFAQQMLPKKVTNLWDYLSGDQLFLEMEFKHLNGDGRPMIKDAQTAVFGRGDKKTVPMSGRKYFRVIKRSVNAKHLELFDEKSSPSDAIEFRAGGEYMRPPKVDPAKASQDPLIISIKCTLYGGIEEKITISLAGWK